MRSRSMHKWMSDEMEWLSTKLARYKPTGSGYKPTGSGYNRIQPVLLSRSVTQMLNNPLPAGGQIGSVAQQERPRSKGVLSRSESEWEEVYPTVQFGQGDSRETAPSPERRTAERKFAYYRNCSTRIT